MHIAPQQIGNNPVSESRYMMAHNSLANERN